MGRPVVDATLLAKVRVVLGTWGTPPDAPAAIALALAAAAVVLVLRGRGRVWLSLPGPADVPPLSTRRFVTTASLAAALLSVGYVGAYLRGGPRIIDATSYFLQGRALSEGLFTWAPGLPSASFRGRFLLEHDGHVGGIFPPGFPLLLALGFLVRAPMLVGPLLAAAIVVATHALARRIATEVLDPARVEPAARLAALASVVCAALRYHTADTMSHGATALAVTVAVERALAHREDPRARTLVAAGVAIGFATATRPFSGCAVAAVCAWLVVERRWRSFAWLAVGALPFVVLLVVEQHAVTGSWLASSQRAYYAVADGPPGCFRWGFGENVGCLHEHGDFVEARLTRGYGVLAALGTTVRRLHLHLLDVASFEPLALLALAGPLFAAPLRRARAVRAILALVLAQVLAYAPFYFDASYPGGGARLYAELLPAEHALLAVTVLHLAPRTQVARAAWAVIASSLLGFAVHASFEHVRLRDREGGRPMFEPDVLARADVRTGLVFVDTDHGFSLGHDPHATTRTGVVVARLRDDDRDRLLYERLGQPATYRYAREPSPHGLVPALRPFVPTPTSTTLRFEGEAEWPPLAQSGGMAVPVWTDACASRRRALALVAEPETPAESTVALPVPASGLYRVTPHIVRARLPHDPLDRGDARAAELRIGDAVWSLAPRAIFERAACEAAAAIETHLDAPESRVVVRAEGGVFALDMVELDRVDEREK